LPDGTELIAGLLPSNSDRKKFTLKTHTTAENMIELVQQFAWLGTALRTSPTDLGVMLCTPRLESQYIHDHAFESGTPLPSSMLKCCLQFEFGTSTVSQAKLPGDCWLAMFRNPILVNGFPISRRGAVSFGLEMSPSIMASLVNAKFVNIFNDRLFIKGFSAMLVATKMIKDLVIWHYVFNPGGQRISYFEAPMLSGARIDATCLEKSRHVVGWCAKNMYNIG
jgi:hypothetical protein